MIVVGICGPIGSGKSSLAQFLAACEPRASAHLETSQVIQVLAEEFNHELAQSRSDSNIDSANKALKALLPALSKMVGHKIQLRQIEISVKDASMHPEWYDKLFIYLDQVSQNPVLLHESITPQNKANYRALLQWLGGYLLYRLNDPLLWYKELKQQLESQPDLKLVALTAPRQPAEAEYVVQVLRGKVLKLERPALQVDSSDVTERLVSSIKQDALVHNNGSLAELKAAARLIYEDLSLDNLKPDYYTRST